ncbi:MAG TPA: ChuX/HutX family heme-like substrate-binding protein, partial [Polyangiaceae bacterium]
NAVIENEGEYGNVEFFGAMGQSVSSIDLRIFASRWKFGFAVYEETKRGPSHGLQFFDASGRAIHKIYLRPESDAAFFADLVKRHTAADQSASVVVSAVEAPPPPKPDDRIDVAGLRDAWRKMTDSHQFFGLLRQFDVARTQALRLAGSDFTRPLARTVAEHLLHAAQKAALPFMTFVGNAGIIQINTSVAKKVAAMGPWINILDPGFDFHLRTDAIEEAWLVRKPTSDGIVTSIEIYDASGEQIVLFVGKRKPGIPESEAWRALAESLPSLASTTPTMTTEKELRS